MKTTLSRDQAYKLIDTMPEKFTWDDLMREIYVRQTIEQGLADSRAGNVKEVHEIRKEYGLA